MCTEVNAAKTPKSSGTRIYASARKTSGPIALDANSANADNFETAMRSSLATYFVVA